MIINYLTHKPIEITENGLHVIACHNPSVYTDLILGMQQRKDTIKVLNETYDEQPLEKVIDWIGDVVLNHHVTDKYMAKLISHYIAALDEVQRQKILQTWHTLYGELQDSLYMSDLPLELDFEEDFKKILKTENIHFDQNLLNQPYGIIETVLKIHQECDLKSVVVMSNVANYLDQQQLSELSKLLKAMKMPLILIEFQSSKFNSVFGDARIYYIDEDLVDWY